MKEDGSPEVFEDTDDQTGESKLKLTFLATNQCCNQRKLDNRKELFVS